MDAIIISARTMPITCADRRLDVWLNRKIFLLYGRRQSSRRREHLPARLIVEPVAFDGNVRQYAKGIRKTQADLRCGPGLCPAWGRRCVLMLGAPGYNSQDTASGVIADV